MNTSKTALKKHLIKLGFKFGLSPEKIEERLYKMMGESRYNDYRSIADMGYEEGRTPHMLYEFPDNKNEALMLMSLDIEPAWESYHAISQDLQRLPNSDVRVIDLGCGLGGLTSWIAQVLPEATVIGVDRNDKLISYAQELNKNTPADYRVWDYDDNWQSDDGLFDVMICRFGIDFDGREGRYDIGYDSYRDTEHYRVKYEEADKYFKAWSRVANTGCNLYACLRMPHTAHGLALVDCAHANGWALKIDESRFLSVEGERFPYLRFVFDSSDAVDENCFISWWMADDLSSSVSRELADDLALQMYRSLSPKDVIKKEHVNYPDGNVLEVELGHCRVFSYVYCHTTRAYARLYMFARFEAHTAEAKFQGLLQQYGYRKNT